MTTRLIIAIVTTLLEEAVLVVIALWGLPQLGIRIPLAGLITIMALWLVWSIFTYQLGGWALARKHLIGQSDMVGSKGKVVSSLSPEGLVRIKGELWMATSADGEAMPGDEIIVVEQNRLKLLVRSTSAPADAE
ncbi:MAG: hypothetical protein HW402_1163 [Dehalococcoidales bacterium]|nr:hypothetical protein [Dehalococcoidales bacterium]